MKRATISDAPAILNMNDRAMWVLGFNAAREAAAQAEPVAWRDAHDHATLYYLKPEFYEVEPLYLASGVPVLPADLAKAAGDLVRCVEMWTNPTDIPLNVRLCAGEVKRILAGGVKGDERG